MARQPSFSKEYWTALRPKVLAASIDATNYALIWAGVLFAHLVIVLVSKLGVDPEMIANVSWVEKYAWYASFAVFFVRFAERLVQEIRGMK